MSFMETKQTFDVNFGEFRTIHGKDGADGDSAYEIAVKQGFMGSEAEWLESLKGEQGEVGPQGQQGPAGPKGETGAEGPQGEVGPKGDTGDTGPQGERGPQGLPGNTGIPGEKGDKGDTGEKGDDGYSPIKGIDYWTARDRQEIIDELLLSVPEISDELLTQEGLIKERLLPIGFPYAYDEMIMLRTDVSNSEDFDLPIKRQPQVGEECSVVCETADAAYVVNATVRDSGSATNCSLWSTDPVDGTYLDFGLIYFLGDSLYASYDAGPVPLSYITVAIPGEVKKLDVRYLPDDIGGGESLLDASGKIDSQYLPDDIGGGTDLLGDDGIIKQEVLPQGYPYVTEHKFFIEETQVTFDTEEGLALLPNTVAAEFGLTYTVSWNGTQYNCVCGSWNDGSMTVPVLGNVGEISGGGNTGEPFVMLLPTEEQAAELGAGVIVFSLDGSESVTLALEGDCVARMDSKFLPLLNDIAFFTAEHNGTDFELDATFSEIYSAAFSGRKEVVLRLVTDSGLDFLRLQSVTNQQVVFSNLMPSRNEDDQRLAATVLAVDQSGTVSCTVAYITAAAE